jgi:hypothetical protein
MQGGGVGPLKFHGANHKEYNLLTDVAVMDIGGQLSNKTPALLQFAVMVCIVIEAYCFLYLAENNHLCVGCTIPFSFHRSEVSFPVLVTVSHWMFRQVHISLGRLCFVSSAVRSHVTFIIVSVKISTALTLEPFLTQFSNYSQKHLV